MRFITEITKDNLDICKDMSRIMEMRHMDGLKGGFGVHDLQYLAIAIMHNSKDEEPQIQVIKSNVKSIIEHQQQVFNDLWNSALPAQDKIKEMGIEVIDRLYVCEDCESSFVFREEMKFHEESTGHKNICEFLL